MRRRHRLQAVQEALKGDAKRKYFEHAGALLTADGTDDHLIKLEGTPSNYQLIIPSYGYQTDIKNADR